LLSLVIINTVFKYLFLTESITFDLFSIFLKFLVVKLLIDFLGPCKPTYIHDGEINTSSIFKCSVGVKYIFMFMSDIFLFVLC